jgi:archaellum component FlaG (FlaF/FlaG flagellin family)
MRRIVLSTIAVALIAASASQAFAAQSHHVRKAAQTTTSEQLRNARNAVAQPSQPAWHYPGWSAPAGR